MKAPKWQKLKSSLDRKANWGPAVGVKKPVKKKKKKKKKCPEWKKNNIANSFTRTLAYFSNEETREREKRKS